MTTTTETRITLSCDRCGTPTPWDRADLEYHLRRLAGGEHAACACDDDCAAECSPWDRERLIALIAQVTP
jgi:hypothetical protein